MKGWIFFFLFLGVLGVASGISGISSYRAEMGAGTTITMHASGLSRLIAAGQGSLFLFVAWGIYRRLRWIWQFIFYLFGIVWVINVVFIYRDLSLQYPEESTPHLVMYAAAIALVFGLIGGFWSYRWYKKKTYFYSNTGDG